MRAETENPVTDELPAEIRPIEFLTENGFSIVRRWEIDRVPPPQSRRYAFLVRDPHNREQETTVEIADHVSEQIAIPDRCRILLCSSYWICCAERHLAAYLWEKDGYPPGNKLVVQQLDPEEVILAGRWEQAGESSRSEQEQRTLDLGGLARWLTR